MRCTRRALAALSLALLGLAAVHAARAETGLHGVRGTILASSSPPVLITIETSSPFAETQVGPLGVEMSLGGLAYDPASGTLYAVDGADETGVLLSLDLASGTATLIGPHNIDPLVGNGDLRGLAYDTKNHVLYAASGAGVPGDLYTLDVTSGSATHVGELPSSPPTPQVGGLAYDSKRDMLVALDFGTGDLYAIDRTTPSSSAVLVDAPPIGRRADGLTYDSLHDLFWVTDAAGGLHSYDPNDGYTRTSHTSLDPPETYGLAFVFAVPAAAVPAMSAWVRVAFAALLVGLGAWEFVARREPKGGQELYARA